MTHTVTHTHTTIKICIVWTGWVRRDEEGGRCRDGEVREDDSPKGEEGDTRVKSKTKKMIVNMGLQLGCTKCILYLACTCRRLQVHIRTYSTLGSLTSSFIGCLGGLKSLW